jgi:transposase
VIRPMTRKTIHILSDGGLTHEAISQTTNTSISTVQRVLREAQPTLSEICSEKVERPHGGRPAIVDPFAERVVALLTEQPALPTTEVLRIATTDWKYQGSRATFFRLVKRLRPTPAPEPMVRFEGLPGEFAQFDFGQADVSFVDGHSEKVHVFVGRLKFSRYLQVIVVPNEQAETLIRSVVACCHAWGGSPLAWVFDNPKTVRISRPHEPIRLHPYLLHLSGEIRVAVELCTPRRGNQKGSVERGVGWVKNSFLLVRRFIDLKDLKEQLTVWLTDMNTVRRCDATKEIPATLLAREAMRLADRPIPWTGDEYPLHEALTVTPVGTIVFNMTPYQVDPRAIGTVATVLVRKDSLDIRTVRGTTCMHIRRDGVRTVQRLPGQAYQTLALLHGERKQNYYRRQCLLELGPLPAQFLEEIIHRHPDGRWVPLVNRLFALLDECGADRMRAALALCFKRERFDLFAVSAALKEVA